METTKNHDHDTIKILGDFRESVPKCLPTPQVSTKLADNGALSPAEAAWLADAEGGNDGNER